MDKKKHTLPPDIPLEDRNLSSIQQFYRETEDKRQHPFFPCTVVQAIHDGRTGASLEAILAQFNDVFLTYQGSPEATRNLLPFEMRRKGITISYIDMGGHAVRERATSALQRDNDHWGLSSNWAAIDELSLSGDISVSAEGNWIIRGEDTGIAARGPEGKNGLTPWFKMVDNRLCVSYDEETWEPLSDTVAAWFRWLAGDSDGQNVGQIQISRDAGQTWEDLSPQFANYLSISGFVQAESSLPSDVALGVIYCVGPTFEGADKDHNNPVFYVYVKTDEGWNNCGRLFNSLFFRYAGTLDTSASYSRFEYVTTDDSCYLSLYDDNSGANYLDTTRWVCIANGKQATLAAQKANEAAANADASRVAVEKTEAAIKEAEAARVTAENERKANEEARVAAESTRNSNENVRKANETAREANESTRKTNEDERASAEDARKAAELLRESNSATAVANAESATKVANIAAEGANAAASKANSSASSADKATETLNAVKEGCTNAQAAANSAAQTAEEKIVEMEALMEAFNIGSQLAPVRMELTYPDIISTKNKLAQKIDVQLYPSYALKNVLFQRIDGDSLKINPSGALTVKSTGETSFYVIPTQNTQLWQEVSISVRTPRMRLSSTGKIRLSGAKIRIV
jgi:hypothetical protein